MSLVSIIICIRHSNQLHIAHTVWFVHPFELPGHGLQDAATIIQELGDFSRDEKYPARMGARIAQVFSSTDLSIRARVEEVIISLDVERNGSCFTDGVESFIATGLKH